MATVGPGSGDSTVIEHARRIAPVDRVRQTAKHVASRSPTLLGRCLVRSPELADLVPELVGQKLREKMDVAHKFENGRQPAGKTASESKSKPRKKKVE